MLLEEHSFGFSGTFSGYFFMLGSAVNTCSASVFGFGRISHNFYVDVDPARYFSLFSRRTEKVLSRCSARVRVALFALGIWTLFLRRRHPRQAQPWLVLVHGERHAWCFRLCAGAALSHPTAAFGRISSSTSICSRCSHLEICSLHLYPRIFQPLFWCLGVACGVQRIGYFGRSCVHCTWFDSGACSSRGIWKNLHIFYAPVNSNPEALHISIFVNPCQEQQQQPQQPRQPVPLFASHLSC